MRCGSGDVLVLRLLAARLAHAYGSRLDLVRVVAPSLLHPGDTPAHARGHKDLRQLEERLEANGLTVTNAGGTPPMSLPNGAGTW